MMKRIKDNHLGISTILSFALIPLSGFATDIYIPSLPSMATQLHASNAAVQLSLVIFMVSGGISQLFVGSILDSYGRYRPGLIALAIFAIASFGIALSHDIYTIYIMRVVQGITVATIVVGKRAYFVDRFSGEKLKHYTSLFSIIWSTAPIIAPFLGGYLQAAFGWTSNFYFLGIFTLVILGFELVFGGESLKQFQSFNARSIARVYTSMIKTSDYALGLIIIAISYAMLVIYGMVSPFILERVFNFSPVVTGYCSLLSGIALMSGGIISKILIRRPLLNKVMTAIFLELLVAAAMTSTTGLRANIYTLMAFTLAMHLLSGFVFNNVFSYCLGRFSQHAGVASGITGGAFFAMASFISYGTVSIVAVKSQSLLGLVYLCLAGILALVFILFRKALLQSPVLVAGGQVPAMAGH